MVDTKKLRELADKARLFGACASFKEGDYHGVAIVGDKVEETFYEVMTIDTEQYEAENFALILAEFYANANPRAILSLLDRISELEKDAARYRWLRDKDSETGVSVLDVGQWVMPASCIAVTYHSADALDAAIDTAMQKD